MRQTSRCLSWVKGAYWCNCHYKIRCTEPVLQAPSYISERFNHQSCQSFTPLLLYFFILSSLAFLKELFHFPGVVICSFASWIVMLDLLTPPPLIFQEKQDPSSTSLQLRNEIQVGEVIMCTCIRVALVKYRQMSLLPKVWHVPPSLVSLSRNL